MADVLAAALTDAMARLPGRIELIGLVTDVTGGDLLRRPRNTVYGNDRDFIPWGDD